MVAVSDTATATRGRVTPLTLCCAAVCDVRARAELGRERESEQTPLSVVWCVARSCVATHLRREAMSGSYCM